MYETIRPDQLELWMDRGEPMMLIASQELFLLCIVPFAGGSQSSF